MCVCMWVGWLGRMVLFHRPSAEGERRSMGFDEERVDGRMQGPNMSRSADLYWTVHTHVISLCMGSPGGMAPRGGQGGAGAERCSPHDTSTSSAWLAQYVSNRCAQYPPLACLISHCHRRISVTHLLAAANPGTNGRRSCQCHGSILAR